MDGVNVSEVSGVEEDADLFFGFSDCGGKDGFASVEFAGGQVPPTVELGVGVAPLGEE
jgi:hypothetical protein